MRERHQRLRITLNQWLSAPVGRKPLGKPIRPRALDLWSNTHSVVTAPVDIGLLDKGRIALCTELVLERSCRFWRDETGDLDHPGIGSRWHGLGSGRNHLGAITTALLGRRLRC